MNEKAQALKMTHTHFSNPTGLDEEDAGNQSTVYDMALLMSYCSQNLLDALPSAPVSKITFR